MQTIRFRGNRQDVMRTLRLLPSVLAGTAPDPHRVAQGLQLRMANVLLSKVQQDFITKSRGGTGEDGIQWEPLAPSTIKARRKGRGGKRSASVDILRDTSELLRSFAAGQDEQLTNADGQIVRMPPGAVVVGTNKKPWHQTGTSRGLPARPFWRDDGKLPASWWRAIQGSMRRGIVRALTLILTGRL